MSKRFRLRAAVIGALALTLVATTSTAAQADDDLPVTYGYSGFLAAGAWFLAHPGGAPAGANDWDCQPSAAHPNPVVLAHGASANMTVNWATISPLLKNNGYCVFALTYGIPAGTPFPLNQIGGRNPMEQSAEELGAFIDQVLAATGAAEVDIVGHSEGSLMPNYYAKFLGGAAKIDKYVALTPLWKGSNVLMVDYLNNFVRQLGLGWIIDGTVGEIFPSALQFLSSSDFIAQMSSGGGPAVAGVTYTNVMTRYDEAVVPYSSGKMSAPNAKNVVLQDLCPFDFAGHGMVAFDKNATQVMLNALDPAHARPVRCSFVAPSP